MNPVCPILPATRRVLTAVPGHGVVLREEPLRHCAPSEVLVKTTYSLVSPGTERHYLARARAGALADELPLGYCAAGTVVDKGQEVREFAIGDRVVAMGWQMATHADYLLMPRRLVARFDHRLAPRHAILATIGATAAHALDRARLARGERVLVVGAGVVGSMVALGAVHRECHVYMHDADASLLDGVPWATALPDIAVVEAAGLRFDVVFLCFDATHGLDLDAWARRIDTSGTMPARPRLVNVGRVVGRVSLVPDAGDIDLINVSRCGTGYRDDDFHHGRIERRPPDGEHTVDRNLQRSLEWLQGATGLLENVALCIHPVAQALRYYNDPAFFPLGIHLVEPAPRDH